MNLLEFYQRHIDLEHRCQRLRSNIGELVSGKAIQVSKAEPHDFTDDMKYPAGRAGTLRLWQTMG